MRSPLNLVRQMYGEKVLHFIVLFTALALAAYTISVVGIQNLFNPAVWGQSITVWFAVAVIGHDLILFPLYALVERLLRRQRRGASELPPAPQPDPHRVPLVNYIRMLTLATGVTVALFYPGIIQQGAFTYNAATGLTQEPFRNRWLLLTAGFHLTSAVYYVAKTLYLHRRSSALTPMPRSRRGCSRSVHFSSAIRPSAAHTLPWSPEADESKVGSVKLNSFGKALGTPAVTLLSAAAVATMVLTACGSDNNSGTSSNAASGGSASSVKCDGKQALKASGSSAQANAMTRFVTAYQAACPDATLNYTSSGSGAGVSEFIGGITDFGGSDSPLNADKGEYAKAKERCGGADAWNLPTVFGPIAVTYNLAGVDGLALDGPTLAKIFNGTVTKWNAPEIAALNNGKALPDTPITVLFRSDESGTTDNFQKYLDAASDGAWGKGAGKSFAGGIGEGAKGNEGTSAAIKSTPGSITYNEWSFAQSQKLSVANIVTSAGPDPVELSTETVGKSIDGVKVKGEGNDLVLDTSSFYKPTETGAYPIVLATYELVCSKYPQADIAPALKAFMTVAIGDGQKGLEDNGYIPIPDKFKERLATAIAAIS